MAAAQSQLENVNPIVKGKLDERLSEEGDSDDEIHDYIDAREIFGMYMRY